MRKALLIFILFVLAITGYAQTSNFISVGMGIGPGSFITQSDQNITFVNATGNSLGSGRIRLNMTGLAVSPNIHLGRKKDRLSAAIGIRCLVFSSYNVISEIGGKTEFSEKYRTRFIAPMILLRGEYDLLKTKGYLAPIMQANCLVLLAGSGSSHMFVAPGLFTGLGIGYEFTSVHLIAAPFISSTMKTVTMFTSKFRYSFNEAGLELRAVYHFNNHKE
jgi:hypothetical protein